jgi:hypothetical protein
MEAHQPGLIVIVTDCCSSRFKLPGKPRRVYLDTGAAATIDPVLRCLLYQSRGLVDITAASGNASFGDDHEGGIFTRAFGRLVEEGIPPSDGDRDGFISWPEFFSRLQSETEGVFVTWAQHQRARGEVVDQTSQKPHAFALGAHTSVVTLRNETEKVLKYQFRWAGRGAWDSASIPPHELAQHVPPSGRGSSATPTLEVRFEGDKVAELRPGKTYRFHDSAKPHGLEEHHETKQ